MTGLKSFDDDTAYGAYNRVAHLSPAAPSAS